MAQPFETKVLPREADDIAPDGSEVRVLVQLEGGGMAHFELAPRQTSTATTHRIVEEIWFFISGKGEMWRRNEQSEQIVDVYPGVSITIPVGTAFQFRSFGDEPLRAIGQTMPPWPDEGDATTVMGAWEPTVGSSAK